MRGWGIVRWERYGRGEKQRREIGVVRPLVYK